MIRQVILASGDFRESDLGAEKMEKKYKKLQVIHRHKKNLIAMNTRGNVMTQIEKKNIEVKN